MRALSWQVLVQLLQYDRFLLRHDFAALHSKVRLLPVASPQLSRINIDKEIAHVCKAVSYACIWYPKPVLCLQRSAVAVALLRRHGIPAVMVIGAKRLPTKAHAWVEVNGRVVNDKPGVQTDYVVMDRC
jgi:hypothetical protein